MCNLDNHNNELKEAARLWILVSILINSVNLMTYGVKKMSVLSKYAHTIILYYIPYQNFTI